jgi:hypothetical protein
MEHSGAGACSSPRSRRIGSAAAPINPPETAPQHGSDDEDSGHSDVEYDEDGFLVDDVDRAHRRMSVSASENSCDSNESGKATTTNLLASLMGDAVADTERRMATRVSGSQ